MKNKRNYLRGNGITLIALVVTIVVLLILAGVSINAVFGDSGIIQKAQDAQNKMDQAAQNDLNEIQELSNTVNKYSNSLYEEEEIIYTPKVNLNGYTPGEWINREVVINLTSENTQTVKYQYSNDNSNWKDCEENLAIDTEQYQDYYFRTVSQDGKVSEPTEAYKIAIDMTPPSIYYHSAPIFMIENSRFVVSYEIYGLIDKGGSGVKGQKIYFYMFGERCAEADTLQDAVERAPYFNQGILDVAAFEFETTEDGKELIFHGNTYSMDMVVQNLGDATRGTQPGGQIFGFGLSIMDNAGNIAYTNIMDYVNN